MQVNKLPSADLRASASLAASESAGCRCCGEAGGGGDSQGCSSALGGGVLGCLCQKRLCPSFFRREQTKCLVFFRNSYAVPLLSTHPRPPSHTYTHHQPPHIQVQYSHDISFLNAVLGPWCRRKPRSVRPQGSSSLCMPRAAPPCLLDFAHAFAPLTTMHAGRPVPRSVLRQPRLPRTQRRSVQRHQPGQLINTENGFAVVVEWRVLGPLCRCASIVTRVFVTNSIRVLRSHFSHADGAAELVSFTRCRMPLALHVASVTA